MIKSHIDLLIPREQSASCYDYPTNEILQDGECVIPKPSKVLYYMIKLLDLDNLPFSFCGSHSFHSPFSIDIQFSLNYVPSILVGFGQLLIIIHGFGSEDCVKIQICIYVIVFHSQKGCFFCIQREHLKILKPEKVQLFLTEAAFYLDM